MARHLTLRALLLGLSLSAFAQTQSKLPPCPKPDNSKKTDNARDRLTLLDQAFSDLCGHTNAPKDIGAVPILEFEKVTKNTHLLIKGLFWFTVKRLATNSSYRIYNNCVSKASVEANKQFLASIAALAE